MIRSKSVVDENGDCIVKNSMDGSLENLFMEAITIIGDLSFKVSKICTSIDAFKVANDLHNFAMTYIEEKLKEEKENKEENK